ncbi:hypothetical protein V6Z11_D07G015300 [Gossypium hirsutum]
MAIKPIHKKRTEATSKQGKGKKGRRKRKKKGNRVFKAWSLICLQRTRGIGIKRKGESYRGLKREIYGH